MTLITTGSTFGEQAIDFQSPIPGVRRGTQILDIGATQAGEPMGFWLGGIGPDTMVALIQTGNGSCEAWSELFGNVLAAQGISDVKVYEVRPNRAEFLGATGILIKNWEFGIQGGTLREDFPYQIDEVSDTGRIAAQGNSNSPSEFLNHYVVVWNEQIYDPSYGSTPSPIEWNEEIGFSEEYEQKAIAGIYYKPGPVHYVRANTERRELQFRSDPEERSW